MVIDLLRKFGPQPPCSARKCQCLSRCQSVNDGQWSSVARKCWGWKLPGVVPDHPATAVHAFAAVILFILQSGYEVFVKR